MWIKTFSYVSHPSMYRRTLFPSFLSRFHIAHYFCKHIMPIPFFPSCYDIRVHELEQTCTVIWKYKDFNLPLRVVNANSVRTAPIHDQRIFLGCESSSIRHNDIIEPALKVYSVRTCTFCKNYSTTGFTMLKHVRFFAFSITLIGTLRPVALVQV